MLNRGRTWDYTSKVVHAYQSVLSLISFVVPAQHPPKYKILGTHLFANLAIQDGHGSQVEMVKAT